MSAPYQMTLDTSGLSNGNHTILVTASDAANNSAIANITVSVNNTLDNGPFVGTYYLSRGSNKFSQPVFSRTDSKIAFDWTNRSPDPRLPVNDYAARWLGTLNFPVSSNYVFRATDDDGMRIWIDGALVWDQWNDRPSDGTFSRKLSAGQHAIRVDYYHRKGPALASLSWTYAP
jgi:PA14 domain-containing protein